MNFDEIFACRQRSRDFFLQFFDGKSMMIFFVSSNPEFMGNVDKESYFAAVTAIIFLWMSDILDWKNFE